MMLVSRASFWYASLLVLTIYQDVHCGPTRLDIQGDTHGENAVNTEYLTIHQITQISRWKRDDVDHVMFPPVLDFSFRFRDDTVDVSLTRNEYMTPYVRLSDDNGRLEHDLGRKTGIYSDVINGASFIVQCEDYTEHCVLTGSMKKGDRMLDIRPELNTPQLHKATNTIGQEDKIYFGNDGIPVPGPDIRGSDGIPVPGPDIRGSDGIPVPGPDIRGSDGIPVPGPDIRGNDGIPVPGADIRGSDGIPVPGPDIRGNDGIPVPGPDIRGNDGIPVPGPDIRGNDGIPVPGADIRGSDGIPVPGPDIRDDTVRDMPTTGRRREKRDIPAGCDIVECYAIVDESVWAFFLTLAGNNVTAAEESLVANYLALYTQADVHYDLIAIRKPGACIRLYLVGVHIQKTTSESWSFLNEAAPGIVKAVPGLLTCGSQGNSLRNATTTIDLIQCFTRKDIVWDEGTGGTALPIWRSLGFTGTVCNDTYLSYNSAVIESTGDKVELLIAHEVAHGLGADHDPTVGCIETDGYIMQRHMAISSDDFMLENIWHFSTCSVDAIYTYLDALSQPSCLRENSFTVSEYVTFKNQPLAGTLYTWEEQCVLRFGTGSQKCDPTGADRTYFPDMCDRGIFCTIPTANADCIGQDRPYDGTACGASNEYCLKGVCNTQASTTTPGGSIGNCAAVGVWITVPGTDFWCNANCPRGFCPTDRCICNTP